MSAVTRRSRIHRVEAARGPATIEIAGTVLMGLAGVVGGVVAAAYKAAAKRTTAAPVVLESLPSMRPAALTAKLDPNAALMSMDDREKLSALLDVGASPYVVQDAPRVSALAKDLFEANTPMAVQRCHRELREALEKGHQLVLVERLVVACKHAAIQTGFQPVATEEAGSERRMTAMDHEGRVLVSEVRIGEDGSVSLATETVNMVDGSCHEILDAFEAALEQEGVRSSDPERKFTGGICELAAAKKAAQEWVQLGVSPRPVGGSPDAQQRRHQMRPTSHKVVR